MNFVDDTRINIDRTCSGCSTLCLKFEMNGVQAGQSFSEAARRFAAQALGPAAGRGAAARAAHGLNGAEPPQGGWAAVMVFSLEKDGAPSPCYRVDQGVNSRSYSLLSSRRASEQFAEAIEITRVCTAKPPAMRPLLLLAGSNREFAGRPRRLRLAQLRRFGRVAAAFPGASD